MAFDDQSSSQIIRTDAVDPFISLRVIGNVKVKKTKPLQKLMEIYSERNGLSIGTLRFLYDGFRIKNDDTPESVVVSKLMNLNLSFYLFGRILY
ncbi:8023_t:CDS:2 [Rhizophagus irregularis]|nr:8023_t:CDS:2 [Rhizophagus irregularis]